MVRFSLSGGVAFQLGPTWLPQMQAAGLLAGECLRFNAYPRAKDAVSTVPPTAAAWQGVQNVASSLLQALADASPGMRAMS